jgi:hypothetical protein
LHASLNSSRSSVPADFTHSHRNAVFGTRSREVLEAMTPGLCPKVSPVEV